MMLTNITTSWTLMVPSKFTSPHSSYSSSRIRVIIDTISSIFNNDVLFNGENDKWN